MELENIRWEQRLQHYQKALAQLESGIHLFHERALNDLEKQGLIQAFEYTHELAWKVMKDFFASRGNLEIYGSKDATRESFAYGLLKTWKIGWI
jgi:nucleotidyltransferase substrate binding protein (TIGR01987 family)